MKGVILVRRVQRGEKVGAKSGKGAKAVQVQGCLHPKVRGVRRVHMLVRRVQRLV